MRFPLGDLAGLLSSRFEAFERLEDESFLSGVEVDADEFGIVRSDDVDLSSKELWERGVIETASAVEFRRFLHKDDAVKSVRPADFPAAAMIVSSSLRLA